MDVTDVFTFDGQVPADSDFLTAIIDTQNDVAAVELDPQAVMQMIVDRSRTITRADGGVIETLSGDTLTHRAASGAAVSHLGQQFNQQGTLSSLCFADGRIRVSHDTQQDARLNQEACRKFNVGSVVIVPLRYADRVIGLLKIYWHKPRGFSNQDIVTLRLMSTVFSAAMHNAQIFEEKKKLLADRMNMIEELRESEERFRAAMKYSAIGKAVVAPTGRWLMVNPAICEILGYTEAELLTNSFQAITHPDDLQPDLELVKKVLAGEIASYRMEKRFFHKRGHIIWALLTVSLVRDAEGKPKYFVSEIQDVTERKNAELMEKDRRAVLEMVARDLPLPEVLSRLAQAIDAQMHQTRSAVMLIQDGAIRLHAPGLDGPFLHALKTKSLQLAVKLSAPVWTSETGCPVSLIQSDETWESLRVVAAESGFESCRTVLIRATDGSPLGLLLNFAQHTQPPSRAEIDTLNMVSQLATICIEHHQTTRQLAHLAQHDILTGLPNRMVFADRLQQASALAKRTGKLVAVMALDIDKFKSINDTYGHNAGDHLLQQFALRLKSKLRECDTLARMGGDEFMVILPELEFDDAAATVAEKFSEVLAEPFNIGEQQLVVTSSIGIAVFPYDAEDLTLLQRHADSALYQIKQNGRNGFAFYKHKEQAA